MDDDQTAATPRKRAAKAKPNDTPNPSAAAEPAATDPGNTPRPRRIPPATFVPPVDPDRGAAEPNRRTTEPNQWSADRAQPRSTPVQRTPAPKQAPAPEENPRPRKAAQKATKKAARKVAPPTEIASVAPPVESPAPAPAPAPAAPAQRDNEAPAKITKKAAPKAAALKKTEPAVGATLPIPPQKAAEPIPTAQTPTPPPAPVTEPPAPAPESPKPAQPPLWPTIRAHPGYATELLALAAVEHIGPQAQANLTWLRDTYPSATADGLARMATTRLVRQARTQGAVAGLLGPLAVLAETAVLLWTQTRLLLDVAAAYGRDPADPERAAELLVLQGVHPDLASARTALAAARQATDQATDHGPDADGDDGDRPPQLVARLLRVAGRALVRMTAARRAARLVPGAGAALTAVLDGRATEQLATRAMKFYRG